MIDRHEPGGTVATLTFAGIARAYTLAELQRLGASISPEPPAVPPPVPPARHLVTRTVNVARRADDHRLSGSRPVIALKRHTEEVEAQALRDALMERAGNCKATARALGISLRVLFYKCKQYAIDTSAYRCTSPVHRDPFPDFEGGRDG